MRYFISTLRDCSTCEKRLGVRDSSEDGFPSVKGSARLVEVPLQAEVALPFPSRNTPFLPRRARRARLGLGASLAMETGLEGVELPGL